MQSLRVAAVSMNSELGQPAKALASIAGWCQRAAEEQADLVLFPELVVHGHCTPNTWELAEAVPDGPRGRGPGRTVPVQGADPAAPRRNVVG